MVKFNSLLLIKELLETENLKFRNYFSKHLLKNLFKISKSKKQELCLKEINPNILDQNSKKFYHLLLELFNFWGSKYKESPIFYFKYLFLKNNKNLPVESKFLNLPLNSDSSLKSSFLKKDLVLEKNLNNLKKKRRIVVKKLFDKNLNGILKEDSIFEQLDSYEKEYCELKGNEKVQKVLRVENGKQMGKEKNEILNEVLFYDEFNQIFNDFIENSNDEVFNKKLNDLYNKNFDLKLLNEISENSSIIPELKIEKKYNLKNEKIIESINSEINIDNHPKILKIKNSEIINKQSKDNSNYNKFKKKKKIFDVSKIEISKTETNSFINSYEIEDFKYLNNIEDKSFKKKKKFNLELKNTIVKNYKNKINNFKKKKNCANLGKTNERFIDYKNNENLRNKNEKNSYKNNSGSKTQREFGYLNKIRKIKSERERNYLKEKKLKEKNEIIKFSKSKKNIKSNKNISTKRKNILKKINKYPNSDKYLYNFSNSKNTNNYSNSKNTDYSKSEKQIPETNNLSNLVNKKIEDINDLEYKINKLKNRLDSNNKFDSLLNFSTTREYNKEKSGTEFVLAMNRDLEKLLINKRRK